MGEMVGQSVLWVTGQVNTNLKRGAPHNLTVTKSCETSLDGLLKKQISDQTVQVRCGSTVVKRAEAMGCAPFEISIDLTSLPQ